MPSLLCPDVEWTSIFKQNEKDVGTLHCQSAMERAWTLLCCIPLSVECREQLLLPLLMVLTNCDIRQPWHCRPKLEAAVADECCRSAAACNTVFEV